MIETIAHGFTMTFNLPRGSSDGLAGGRVTGFVAAAASAGSSFGVSRSGVSTARRDEVRAELAVRGGASFVGRALGVSRFMSASLPPFRGITSRERSPVADVSAARAGTVAGSDGDRGGTGRDVGVLGTDDPVGRDGDAGCPGNAVGTDGGGLAGSDAGCPGDAVGATDAVAAERVIGRTGAAMKTGDAGGANGATGRAVEAAEPQAGAERTELATGAGCDEEGASVEVLVVRRITELMGTMIASVATATPSPRINNHRVARGDGARVVSPSTCPVVPGSSHELAVAFWPGGRARDVEDSSASERGAAEGDSATGRARSGKRAASRRPSSARPSCGAALHARSAARTSDAF